MILGPDGSPWRQERLDSTPATAGMPSTRVQGMGDMPLPHVLTYSALLNTAYRTYFARNWDEARKRSREDAITMRNDAYLMGLMQERTLRVTSLPWHLEVPDEKDPRQKMVRDHIDKAIRHGPRFKRYCGCLQDGATWYGRTANEHTWKWTMLPAPPPEQPATFPVDAAGGMGQPPRPAQGPPIRTLQIKRWQPINGDKINHKWDGTPTIQVNSAYQDVIPGAEFVYDDQSRALVVKGTWQKHFQFHQHWPEDSDYMDGVYAAEAIHGKGIRSVIFWWNFIRLERSAVISDGLDRNPIGGLRLWYFELGNDASYQAVLKASQEQSGKVDILLPRSNTNKNSGLEVVGMDVTGVEACQAVVKAAEEYITWYIVGQKMSRDHTGSGGLGGSGAAEAAEDTQNHITSDDANNLAESLTGSEDDFGVVYYIQKNTFPDTLPGMPNGFPVRFVYDVERAESEKKLEAISALVEARVPVKADDMRAAAGVSKPGEGDELVPGPAPEPSPFGVGATDPNADPADDPSNEEPFDDRPSANGVPDKIAARLGTPDLYAYDPNQPRDSFGMWTSTGNGKRIDFVPHEKAGADESTVMVDPRKVDSEWSKSQDYYLPTGGKGVSEVKGRREAFEKFLEKGQPVQASRASLGNGFDFIDGRHRFAVLRDKGVNRVAMTVPKAEVDEFIKRFGPDPDKYAAWFDAMDARLATLSAKPLPTTPETTTDHRLALIASRAAARLLGRRTDRYAAWNESQHPRGQPNNAGEFAKTQGASDDSEDDPPRSREEVGTADRDEQLDNLNRFHPGVAVKDRPAGAIFDDPNRKAIEDEVEKLIDSVSKTASPQRYYLPRLSETRINGRDTKQMVEGYEIVLSHPANFAGATPGMVKVKGKREAVVYPEESPEIKTAKLKYAIGLKVEPQMAAVLKKKARDRLENMTSKEPIHVNGAV